MIDSLISAKLALKALFIIIIIYEKIDAPAVKNRPVIFTETVIYSFYI